MGQQVRAERRGNTKAEGNHFTFSQIPMLLKHGLAIEDRDEVVKDEPPTA